MVKLIDNKYVSQKNHCDQLIDLLTDAVELDWMVAFAKETGFNLIEKALDATLSSVNFKRARFVFGLDFYQTDPCLLRKFLDICNKHHGLASLYITNDGFDGEREDDGNGVDDEENDENYLTFHPKVYSHHYADGSYRVMVGSANFTSGGLESNHELSMLLKLNDPGNFPQRVADYIDKLVNTKTIIPATNALIDDYDERRFIFKTYANNAKTRAKNRANKASPLYDKFDLLRVWLETMKLDTSPYGFYNQVETRTNMKSNAMIILNQLASHTFTGNQPINKTWFLNNYYGHLVGMAGHNHYWTSKNLQILMSSVASCYNLFQTALKAFLAADKASNFMLTPQKAYNCLYDNGFKNVTGGGVNVITEILHSYDNKRFPIMNQNSAGAVHLAKLGNIYPAQMKKIDIYNKNLYERFSDDVKQIQTALVLNDFTEFDALGNYIYWW